MCNKDCICRQCRKFFTCKYKDCYICGGAGIIAGNKKYFPVSCEMYNVEVANETQKEEE